jgi:small subunit ribosomal protein S2
MTQKLSLASKSRTFKKGLLLEDHFIKYQVLIGNKLRFTNPQTHGFLSGLNFGGNTIFKFQESLNSLRRTLQFIQGLNLEGGKILFISTRSDLKEIVAFVGSETKSPYVNHRWLKGLLTNWETASTSIRFYNLFFKKLTLKTKQKKKLIAKFSGLQSLTELPDAVFIFDLKTDKDALKEARLLNIPIIGIVDTDSSLKTIDYPILGNASSILSIAFFSNLIISALKKTS